MVNRSGISLNALFSEKIEETTQIHAQGERLQVLEVRGELREEIKKLKQKPKRLLDKASLLEKIKDSSL